MAQVAISLVAGAAVIIADHLDTVGGRSLDQVHTLDLDRLAHRSKAHRRLTTSPTNRGIAEVSIARSNR